MYFPLVSNLSDKHNDTTHFDDSFIFYEDGFLSKSNDKLGQIGLWLLQDSLSIFIYL